MIKHYDLFAGIGGFSLALEEVFNNDTIRHVFCEWERFPTAVLKRHWPDAEYWGDIAELVADTQHARLEGRQRDQGTGHVGFSNRVRTDETSHGPAPDADRQQRGDGPREIQGTHGEVPQRHDDAELGNADFSIVTGGFPCQPFSHAGRRKGTADDRYQWPNMLGVIRNVDPEWVIAENVRGLVTWNDGLVLETVCSDLEELGYEVQPFIIPAVAVGAPHKRDRIWIVGRKDVDDTKGKRRGDGDTEHKRQATAPQHVYSDTSDERTYPDWNRNWQEVAFATCDESVDDGLPRLVDGVPVSRAKWRKDSLKAYGNGIVNQVAVQIMKGIKEAEMTT